MKFLGWMHRKLMEKGTEPMKNPQTGNPSVCLSVHTMFDEQNYYVKPTKTLSDSNIKRQKSSNRMEANNVEVLIQEELFEPFDFLAIGTFGTELLNTDPPTPKLPMPSEELTNQQAEITENDLKLINYELEKFLEAEEKENGYDTTSERVSTASIVTLSNKISEKADSEDHMGLMTCPLQDYLFATPVELAETDKEVEKEKKLLEELFKRNNIIPDDLKRNHEVAEQRPRKRDIAHFMKKVVKKFHLSSRSSTASENDAAVSLPIKKKLSKALKKFQRKIHPEQMNEKQFVKLQKGEKKYISQKDASQIGGHNEHNMAGQFGSRKSENSTPKLSSSGISNGATTTNGEHWIKTDSDYLVLEL